MRVEHQRRQRAAPAPSGPVVVARIVAVLLASEMVLAVLTLALVFSPLASLAGGPLDLGGLGIAEAGSLGVVLLIWRLVDRQPIDRLGLAPRRRLRRWLRGAGVALLMMVSVVLVSYALFDPAQWSLNPDPASAAVALSVGLLAFVVQGPSEEVLYRGYILENVARVWGPAWGVGVSAVSFALLHAANAHFGVLPFCNLLLFGLAAAVYKLRVDRGQLWGVFGIHTVWNWLEQVVFGLPNSGMSSSPGLTLWHVEPDVGVPDVIWGGGFGPEGTLAATVVLAVLVLATLRLGRSSSS
jgi:membrane protease YdiL (CAAX protease family)